MKKQTDLKVKEVFKNENKCQYVFDDLNSSFLSDKIAKQKVLSKVQNDLSNLKEKELNSKFIKEQKEKIINHFRNLKS